MRALTFLTVSAALALSLEMAAPRAAGCDPVGEIRFVCGQAGPEDLVVVPGSDWIIASAYGADGGLHLIDVKAGTSTRVFPSATAREHPDTKTYDSCPGPLEGTDRDKFRTHGLYLKPGRNSVHTLYVVHHGNRESVEIFELDARPKQPPPRRPAGARGGFSSELLEGKNNGEVWEWHTGAGWKKVPGSEAAGANGLEISKDGKWYYLAEWGNRSFMRLSRGQTPVKRDEIPLGFRVDNVRWAPDGLLFVAGQGGADAGRGQARGTAGGPPSGPTSVVGKVDPKTLKYQEIINYPGSAEVSFATVAVQTGNELWVGSSRGDRIARYPATGLRRPQ
jgi:hypothetical protein